MQRILFTILFCAVILHTTTAQNFTISSELRPRAEIRDGYKTLFSDNDHFAAQVSQRTRLNFGYQKENLSMYLSVQDVRLWGDIAIKKDIAGTFLNEAWANLKLNDAFSVKFGRQELKYDNQRIIASSNWNQVSAKHDAAKFLFQKNNWNIDFIAAYNQSDNLNKGTLYMVDKFYKTLNVLWITKKIGNVNISSLHVLDGYQSKTAPETIYARYTPGISTKYKKKKLMLYGCFYYQTGLVEKGKDISAYYFNMEASHKFSNKFSVTAGLDFLSGNNPDKEKYNAFDILYGKKHGMNGYMDYYHTTSSTKDAGLVNPYIKLSTQINEKSVLMFDYHYLSLEKNTLNTGVKVDKYLGSEFDLTYKFKYNKDINLNLGYSVLFASNTSEIIKGGNKNNIANFAYVMITIKPTLFKTSD